MTSHEPRELDGVLARGDGLAGQLEDFALKGPRNIVPEAFPHLKPSCSSAYRVTRLVVEKPLMTIYTTRNTCRPAQGRAGLQRMSITLSVGSATLDFHFPYRITLVLVWAGWQP